MSSVTHSHALFIGIFPFADEDAIPQSPLEHNIASTMMRESACVTDTHARTGDHFHHHHREGQGGRVVHSSPTHGHGLVRRPLRPLITPGLVLSSVTHGHALRSVPSPSTDGEGASPTTPTTPRASRRTTRTSSLFSIQSCGAEHPSEEPQDEASLPEMLVHAVKAFFGEGETHEPSSEGLVENRQREDVHGVTHRGGSAFATGSGFEDMEV